MTNIEQSIESTVVDDHLLKQIEEAAKEHCLERAHGLMTQAWVEGAKWALEYVKKEYCLQCNTPIGPSLD